MLKIPGEMQEEETFLRQLIVHLHHGETVLTRGKKYKELSDINYVLPYKDPAGNTTLAPSEQDESERVELLHDTTFVAKELVKDPGSRRATVHGWYENKDGEIVDDNIAGCLSLFQFLLRDNTLDLYVFVRSQHIDSFMFDNTTFMMMMEKAVGEISTSPDASVIDPGKIIVHITSLHKDA